MKLDGFTVFPQREFEFPKRFGVKVLDSAVLVYYEAEGGELA
jgi:hypothetical protein